MPKEIVEEIEKDELEAYSDEVKWKKLKKLKGLSRRAPRQGRSSTRTTASAGRNETAARRERRIKSMLQSGEQQYVGALKSAAEAKLEFAKKAYKEAHETGDSDQLLVAQQAMTQIQMELERANNFKLPPLQEESFQVQIPQEPVRTFPGQTIRLWSGKSEIAGLVRIVV